MSLLAPKVSLKEMGPLAQSGKRKKVGPFHYCMKDGDLMSDRASH